MAGKQSKWFMYKHHKNSAEIIWETGLRADGAMRWMRFDGWTDRMGSCSGVNKLAEHNITLPPIFQAFDSIELVSWILDCNLDMRKILFFIDLYQSASKWKCAKA